MTMTQNTQQEIPQLEKSVYRINGTLMNIDKTLQRIADALEAQNAR